MPPSAWIARLYRPVRERATWISRLWTWYQGRVDFRLILASLLVLGILVLVAHRRRERLRSRGSLPPVHRWRQRVALREGEYPYHAKRFLLTRSEREFYHALLSVIRERFTVAMSVRLADVINCSRDAWSNGHGALISAKQLDFVLCHPETIEIVLAIELDDRSHDLAERVERDAFLDNSMRAAGVPLLRVPAARSYEPAQLRASIRDAIAARPRQGRAA